jgi:hypothetical protein
VRRGPWGKGAGGKGVSPADPYPLYPDYDLGKKLLANLCLGLPKPGAFRHNTGMVGIRNNDKMQNQFNRAPMSDNKKQHKLKYLTYLSTKPTRTIKETKFISNLYFRRN